MSEILAEFEDRHEDVFAAYQALTNQDMGGEFKRAADFFESVQRMLDSGEYGSDDLRTALFMMDSVRDMPECKLTLDEDQENIMRRRIENGINAIELH